MLQISFATRSSQAEGHGLHSTTGVHQHVKQPVAQLTFAPHQPPPFEKP
jgi:hypothetical protein